MADAQISQSGPFFPKTGLLDAKSFDFAGRSDFDEKAAVLYSAQDAGVRDENLHRACTKAREDHLFPVTMRKSIIQID